MDLICVFCLIVFVHISQCRVYVLRDYDDEPMFINPGDRIYHNDGGHSELIKALSNSISIKPNRVHNGKHAILHYGRHTYHLDSFEDLTKLRSELPDYISYDYFDINDLVRSRDLIPLDYIQNLVDLASLPSRLCKGRKCVEDQRKYSPVNKKRSKKEIWRKNKLSGRILKRFKIVNNKQKHAGRRPKISKEATYESKEKYREKKKPQAKHKYKQSSSESTSTSVSNESEESKEFKESEESSSDSESLETWHTKKEKEDSDSKSTEESTESTEKPTKTFSDSDSSEEKSEAESSDSIEVKPTKKRNKSTYHSSEEMRKKFDSKEDLLLQGNKIYSINDVDDNDDDSKDERRRLPQFLPKRFHWDPSDIHELGYYWFNGPKGRYPAPQALL